MKVQQEIGYSSVIQGLNFGAKFLPQRRWFSQSGLRLSLAASVLGAAGLVLVLKGGKVENFMNFGRPWSSDDYVVSSEKNWVVPGLQNLGNNCFLNVILQALASCSRFRRFLEEIFEEYEFESVEEYAKTLPLMAAVASLLEELSVVRDGRSVLNPRKLMVTMDQYVPRFNLTSQQDAEEAFFHLLSSLREEFSECYVPNNNSLVDVTAPHNFRIVSSTMMLKESEQQRWRRSFLGPFDGIIGSILTCQSCSFQISMDFQLFHSLHLPPVLSFGGGINAGCSLEDCLGQFFVSEQLEDYFCSHCWHVSAIKYLTVIKNQTDIEKLRQCNEDDSCDCKNLCSLSSLPWSNSFSRSFKQLSIARSPQILCIHLQRASVNLYGESLKLLGHISFPLILDLSPFIKSGIKNWEQISQKGQRYCEYQPPLPCTDHQIMQVDGGLANCTRVTGRKISLEKVIPDKIPKDAHAGKASPNMSENGGYADFMMRSSPWHPNYKGNGPSASKPSREHMYRLVSVVQHFGKVGSGHYTVYRRVKAETTDEDPVVLLEPTRAQWFCISDSDVHGVSEKDVLEAEASLLFYEKIG